MAELWKNKLLIVIAGPTAVGKTETAIRLAQFFKTEIVSADSRQIFKELTIGTAKPSASELSAVPHHFINTHSIHTAYDAAQYGRDALDTIHRLFGLHDTVILCGGSGLYIKAVLEGFDDIPEIESEIRDNITKAFHEKGLSWLQQEMQQHDPEHYAVIDHQNPHRLIRALEVKMGTGLSISAFQKKNKLSHPFRIVKVGLELTREALYARIDNRMDKMIGEGLFLEAELLHRFKHQQALQTVGYKEIFDYMDGEYDREEAVRLLKRNSRRYAKRQLTWFKRDAEIRWYQSEQVDDVIDFIGAFKTAEVSEPESI